MLTEFNYDDSRIKGFPLHTTHDFLLDTSRGYNETNEKNLRGRLGKQSICCAI